MNHLFHGDSPKVLRDSIRDESVDQVHLDPTFASNAGQDDRSVDTNYRHKDENGWLNRLAISPGPGGASNCNAFHGPLDLSRRWRCSHDNMAARVAESCIVQTKPGRFLQYKPYLYGILGGSAPDDRGNRQSNRRQYLVLPPP